METKMIRVPFEVELARRIQDKECEGKIVTRDGRNARIVCWDKKSDSIYNIVALFEVNTKELICTYSVNGFAVVEKESESDLFLEIPEYMTFKDGDVIASGWNYPQNSCKWISIIKDVAVSSHGILTHNYATLIVESNNGTDGQLNYDDYSNSGTWIEKATEEERQKRMDALKASEKNEAKDCLKKLGIEEKQEYEFKFRDLVLVRSSNKDKWCAAEFSNKDGKWYVVLGGLYYEICIPYNEQTAHLLGTTDNIDNYE